MTGAVIPAIISTHGLAPSDSLIFPRVPARKYCTSKVFILQRKRSARMLFFYSRFDQCPVSTAANLRKKYVRFRSKQSGESADGVVQLLSKRRITSSNRSRRYYICDENDSFRMRVPNSKRVCKSKKKKDR
jgi:hypothetical protein